MTKKPKKTPLTDAERHERFVKVAREAGASEDPEAFEKAFKRVTSKPPEHSG